MDFKESDLYSPVCNYFTELGYDVQAEVKSCDLIAKKDSEIIIAELKKNFCLKLVYQAIERQSITDSVYVVIPRPKKGAKGSEWNNMLKLMKKLNIGIITVAVDSPLKTVDIVSVPESVSVPKSSKKRSSVNKEVETRNLRTNIGGVSKTKILTAYREKSIFVLCIVEYMKNITPSQQNKFVGDTNSSLILYKNYYGWFEKISKGVYALSEKGLEILCGNEYSDAVSFYRNKVKEIISSDC